MRFSFRVYQVLYCRIPSLPIGNDLDSGYLMPSNFIKPRNLRLVPQAALTKQHEN